MTDASKEENGTLSPDDNPDRTGPGSGEYDAADGQESEVSSAGMSLEEIRRQVQERVNQEASQAPPAEAPPEINSKFIGECLFSNELGDGTLYSALHRGRFVYVKNAQEWFEWAGHYWQQDIMQRSLAQVERVAAEYLEEYKRSAQEIIQLAAKPEDDEIKSRISKLQALQKALLARARALRGNKRRSACLNFSHTLPENPLAIKGNEFDMRPMLFPCGNGVIDLETGRLKPGRPERYHIVPDWLTLPTLGARFYVIGAYLFPDPAYIEALYPGKPAWQLPYLYLRRFWNETVTKNSSVETL